MTEHQHHHHHRKPFLLTFDVEEFDLPAELGKPLPAELEIRVTDRGVHEILRLLATRDVRATFFITGRFAETYPNTVRAIVSGGHESAVHGMLHSEDYGRMDPSHAVRRLRYAREIVEAASRRPVFGVRMPHLRPCPADVVRAVGFRYDATPHPTWIPGRYWGLHWPRSPWTESDVLRVPISVLPGIRLPVSWVWFRSVGPQLGVLAARAAAWRAPYLHVYFHPWEALRIRSFGVPRWLALRTGPAFLHDLDRLLAWAVTAMAPMPVGEFVAGMHDATTVTRTANERR